MLKPKFEILNENNGKNAIMFAYLMLVKEDYAKNIAVKFQLAIKRRLWNKVKDRNNTILTNSGKLGTEVINALEKFTVKNTT